MTEEPFCCRVDEGDPVVSVDAVDAFGDGVEDRCFQLRTAFELHESIDVVHGDDRAGRVRLDVDLDPATESPMRKTEHLGRTTVQDARHGGFPVGARDVGEHRAHVRAEHVRRPLLEQPLSGRIQVDQPERPIEHPHRVRDAVQHPSVELWVRAGHTYTVRRKRKGAGEGSTTLGLPQRGGGMAITGAHVLLYSPEAEQLRATLQEVTGWHHVDAHAGWPIFALPPAELGVHPADAPRHELSLMCDDIHATVADLRERGIEIRGEPEAAGFGVQVTMVLPGGVEVMLYQPRHITAV